jgi:uncharacterized membrane protein
MRDARYCASPGPDRPALACPVWFPARIIDDRREPSMSHAIAVESPPGPHALELRPNRSISAAGLKGFFVVMAATSLTVAGFSYAQGNVFAPVFAVLELSLLAFCLRLVWRGLNRAERIVFGEGSVDVERDRDGLVARFDPYWVRVESEPGASPTDRRRLLLTSHGRSIEVGAFLNEEERSRLEQRLKELIAARRVRPVD